MARHLAYIPLNKIRKIEIYQARGKYTAKELRA